MTDLEDRLRAELNRHAEHAPGGTLLAERIIAAARTQPRPAGRGWPTWTLPLLAAGAVAAIVTGVFVGVSQVRNSAGPAVPGIGTHRPSLSHSAPAPSPTATPTSTTTGSPPADPVGLNNVALSDLTFVGTEDGWGLGTAECLSGSGGRCPAMVRTTDGGASWRSMPQPPGDVTGIRFATPLIGYAFSASTLEMTRDGGRTWTTQAGGALALETLDGNVIRVVSDGSGCPGPCNVRVEYAGLASSDWTTVALQPGNLDAVYVHLVRDASDAYVLTTRNPASGAGVQTSTLFASADDGASWTGRGEPCPQRDGLEADSVALAAAPGGGVTALCQVRQGGSGADFLVRSSDHGANFTPASGTIPQFEADVLAGDPATVLVAGGAHAYRSTDGGRSWSQLSGIDDVSFAGFESPTLGRIVTEGGRTIWTTTDAGAHWSRFTFPA
jgi:hypothetical protein